MVRSSIVLVGAACRLPGAESECAFRELLDEARCSVRRLPEQRWDVARLLHPATTEPGFSYSFAGGYLDDPFAFDPAVFGISPREAQQMDPQQRLLLEVVWEALENAHIGPTSLGGSEIGVYVGASSLDYGNLHASDPASIDSYFMTGNTLSVVSNRISYVFDWHGPSFTVDTACSSSLVALAQAVRDLDAGRIDTAVVGGVNVLLSPASFVGFSRASMLSPTGLCRPFSAAGDGYVRGEGAVAVVLRRAEAARRGTVRAEILAAEINSDGRTSGIALPRLEGQQALLERVYGELGLAADAIAFVEAHGTGTRVGDPIEATAIGRVLGRRRSRPLPIGSVKSNIGHLEPASGLAGLLKALIALETRRLPATLHIDRPNPLIDFAALHLSLAREAVDLDETGDPLLCGVSSFGFGGTNAHVVMRGVPLASAEPAEPADTDFLVLSAASRDTLRALADAHADLIDRGIAPGRLAAAVAADRDLLKHRIAVPVDDAVDAAGALRRFAAGGRDAEVIEGSAPAKRAKICFVYSGNGAQWAGMGRLAYATDPAFRRRFDEIAAVFSKSTGRSLVDDLHAEDIAERMQFGAFVQPLIFALQSAITAGLVAAGIRPDVVIGHSVGELAAADAAGILSLDDAMRVVLARSSCQEAVHGQGTMAVFAAERATVAEFIARLGRDDIEIAAENGPNSVTVAGSHEAVRLAARRGRRERLAARVLDLEYPFHSRFLDEVREPMLAALGRIDPHPARMPLVSTVTGEPIGDGLLGEEHWWLNVRAPVQFRRGIEAAAALGADLFIEIGPRPILLSPISDTLQAAGIDARVLQSLAESDDRTPTHDPIRRIVARAIANGATIAGSDGERPVDGGVALPTYPWHHADFRFSPTSERLEVFTATPRHPLIGGRLAQGMPEWRTLLDARVVPYLADHVVEDEIVVPGAAFAEMILAVARELDPEGPIGFEDMDILVPMVLSRTAMREVSVRHSGSSGFVEVWSRPRLGPDEWSLHARGRILPIAGRPHPAPAPSGPTLDVHDHDEIYARAAACGLDYGPAFRLAQEAHHDDVLMDVRLAPPREAGTGFFERPQLLHPVSLDAALHALFCVVDDDPAAHETHLPVRFGRLALYTDHPTVTAARLRIDRRRSETLTVSMWLFDADGAVVAEVEGLLLRTVSLGRADGDEICYHVAERPLERAAGFDVLVPLRDGFATSGAPTDGDEGRLMLRAHMQAVAHRALARLASDGRFDPVQSVTAGRLAETARAFATMLAEDLVAAGLARHDGDGFVLADDTALPEPERILTTYSAEFPGGSAELLLAARTAAEIDVFLSTGRPIAHRSAILEQFEGSGDFAASARAGIAAAIDRLIDAAGPIPPHVLLAEPDCRVMLSALLPRVARGRLRLTIAGRDRLRLERLAARLPVGFDLDTLDLGDVNRNRRVFDLAVVVQFRYDEEIDVLAEVVGRVVDGGAVVVVQPAADPLWDFCFGTEPKWFAQTLDDGAPIGRVPLVAETRRRLEATGVIDVVEHPLGGDDGSLLSARVVGEAVAPTGGRRVRITPLAGAEALAGAIDREIRDRGGEIVGDGAVTGTPRLDHLLLLPHDRGDDRRRTERAIALLRKAIAAAGRIDPRPLLHLVVRSGRGTEIDPVAEAVRDFARVALNEHADTGLRVIDLDPELPDAAAAAALADRLADDDLEHEVAIGPEGIAVPRIRRGLPFLPAAMVAPEAMELRFPRRGTLELFSWRAKSRRRPEVGEIEVEVIATGLNFRDVMLAQGLLDDDVLDDGLAGAVFGFECVGRVTAIGAGVGDHAVGDLVLGFAASAFATHVTAAASGFIAVPAGIPVEAAAAVPVAFLTAWYGLVELARLRPGETVLVHGAAGGVGLAAIQIARARGARVVATVSTPDKRALVELLGASIVHDSRSIAFAEAIRAELGGVDVVLNSLSGDAMRAGLKCLKPFGRFIELGKRDYVGNSELALRPFRRNLTYFGVDVDQLLVHDPATVARGLAALVEGFADGSLTAPPHRVFGAAEIGEAFRLMQSAGHVGKIVVRPPVLLGRAVPPVVTADFRPAPGVQIVVGGTGGFGFETACRLAAKGATAVVVASRRGTVDDAAAARIAALSAAGVDFRVERVDATDPASVEALIARVTTAIGPISGIWLTAMVLDDGLIDGLDEARISRVLGPKIDGAANFDRATRDQPIAHFVMFSSATVLIGNPGQGSYVAANGWLEGLARRRRAEGLPALAVGWGAISDVGVLARDPETAKRLERLTGVAGMTAAEALRRLDGFLVRADLLADPVVHCVRFQRIGAIRELAMLSTAAFDGVFRGDESEAGDSEIDLAERIAGKSEAEALHILGEIVTAEVARILRLSAAEIDLGRPLDELGLDSLMALELRMSVEARYGIELPLVAVTSVKNLHDLARRMLQSIRSPEETPGSNLDAADGGLIAMHGGDEAAFAGLGAEIETRRQKTEVKP
jgi:acyl transferase domain-containing protein/NADPH:quinone reductase-like Zn-dependent oxidoreductase/acyl carrier protein